MKLISDPPPKKGRKKPQTKQKNPPTLPKMKVREPLRSRHVPTELSNFLSFHLGKKTSGKTLTHSIFLFFSGDPAGHGEGGADGASINKYIYNNIPARGQAAAPARPGTYSSAIMTPARGGGGVWGGRAEEEPPRGAEDQGVDQGEGWAGGGAHILLEPGGRSQSVGGGVSSNINEYGANNDDANSDCNSNAKE